MTLGKFDNDICCYCSGTKQLRIAELFAASVNHEEAIRCPYCKDEYLFGVKRYSVGVEEYENPEGNYCKWDEIEPLLIRLHQAEQEREEWVNIGKNERELIRAIAKSEVLLELCRSK